MLNLPQWDLRHSAILTSNQKKIKLISFTTKICYFVLNFLISLYTLYISILAIVKLSVIAFIDSSSSMNLLDKIVAKMRLS